MSSEITVVVSHPRCLEPWGQLYVLVRASPIELLHVFWEQSQLNAHAQLLGDLRMKLTGSTEV